MAKTMSRSEAVRRLVQSGLAIKPDQVPFTLFANDWGARIGFTNAQLRENARCRAFYERFASCFDKDFLFDCVFLTEANLPVPPPVSTPDTAATKKRGKKRLTDG